MIDVAAPDPPSNLDATALDHERIQLTWDAGSPDSGDYYEVARVEGTTITTEQADNNIIASEVTQTEYEDTELDPSTDYAYRVRAVNDSGFGS